MRSCHVVLTGLMELAGFFTAHAVWKTSLQHGPLVPLLAWEKDGERSMIRFDSEESRESAVKKGQELLSANEEGAERAILLFDAFVTLGGERTDALVVQGFVYGYSDLEVEIIQPYRPFASKGGFAVMQPKVSFPDEHVDQAQALIDAFFRGLDSHEEGGPLWLQSIVASG